MDTIIESIQWRSNILNNLADEMPAIPGIEMSDDLAEMLMHANRLVESIERAQNDLATILAGDPSLYGYEAAMVAARRAA